MGTSQGGSKGSDATRDRPTAEHTGSSIFSATNFLLATRDSGYRTTSAAISEFIDNAIQAKAKTVDINVTKNLSDVHPIEISVSDDGKGMTESELSQALAFGGSARFGDRSSLGRYGMGLPNAALSRARRLDVYSWTTPNRTIRCSMDLDELVSTHQPVIAAPVETPRPADMEGWPQGTVVHLQRCDRLEFRRTIGNKLNKALGRTYHHFLSRGLQLSVNGTPVLPDDPLFLSGHHEHYASVFGESLLYELTTTAGSGTVKVTFTELPVEAWSGLSVQAKRDMGITNAATISVVRAEREIDSGWWFMGKKRRQNYDDWWRCEVSFDPELDELFGITHSKQQITPTRELTTLLSSDLEPIANALNARVRRRFERASRQGPLDDAACTAAMRSQSLPQLQGTAPASTPSYRFEVGEVLGTSAFTVEANNQDLIVTLNERHPFYRDVLKPLAESDVPGERSTAKGVALVLLAMARTEASLTKQSERTYIDFYRSGWSDVAATFLNV